MTRIKLKDKDAFKLAWQQHVTTNPHHPEFWGGVENMPDFAIAEMVCDWYARSQEFGASVREWYQDEAMGKFKILKDSYTDGKINEYFEFFSDIKYVNQAIHLLNCFQDLERDISGSFSGE